MKDGLCFLAGEARDVCDGVFVGERIFGDVRWVHVEGETSLREQFATARRG
jgi:hypothetical protein